MPLQVANVRRQNGVPETTFDLILPEGGSEIKVEGCAIITDPSEPSHISLRNANIDLNAAKAIMLKALVALSFA